jgi:hypothetical protein
MAEFVAIKPAFYRGSRVRVGQKIQLPSDFEGSWAEPAKPAKPAEAKKAPARKKAAKKKN